MSDDAVSRAGLDRPSGDGAPRVGSDRSTGYRADLDGLRAIAVVMVMLTHAKWPVPNDGGVAGVTAFFVLSGYLITNLLVDQRARRGRIDVLGFYRRRVVRLAPALLGLLAFTLLFGMAIGWGSSHWQGGLLSCLLYVSNWVQVADISIDPLGHTWSLAIEEQFYLLWPALLILLRGRILAFAVVGIVVGSVLRVVATGPLEYFSTITRADAILVGCVVALARPRWPTLTAVAGIAGLVAVTFLNPSHDIGIPAAMLATAAIIAGRFEPLGHLAPIGLRAYSLYLWNWPMTILFGAFGLLAPLMTVLAGEASFRLLEAPVLHRGRRDRIPAAPLVPPAWPGPNDPGGSLHGSPAPDAGLAA
jgi:peptidoglycan/LPS O-acetylase OafA/YrhL